MLRVSWTGKSLDQVEREAAVLSALAAQAPAAGLPALPLMRMTLDGRSYVHQDGCWLHLFDQIPGHSGFPQHGHASQDALTARIMIQSMHTLAHLHAAMAAIPLRIGAPAAHGPASWLTQRHARISARPMPTLPAGLEQDYGTVLAHAHDALAAAAHDTAGPIGWLHGDFHAGNLLFLDGGAREATLTGILDFDDVGIGSQWLEAAFALFALARDATIDHAFVHDAHTWDLGLNAYAEHLTATNAATMKHYLRNNRAALMTLFCVDQTLIHLEAAQRHLWQLGPGIGFLGCWNQIVSDAHYQQQALAAHP
ncbi:hypothetical protein ASB57_00315 [Bordetella sp. N]|nr:hypothetical protein ASB57_00315 [Bordetella sp. N]